LASDPNRKKSLEQSLNDRVKKFNEGRNAGHTSMILDDHNDLMADDNGNTPTKAARKKLSKHELSADDIDLADEVKNPGDLEYESQAKNDEGICIVCMDKAANAVFMNCGHGGVCYDCAMETWKKSNFCVVCRSEIKAIYEV